MSSTIELGNWKFTPDELYDFLHTGRAMRLSDDEVALILAKREDAARSKREGDVENWQYILDLVQGLMSLYKQEQELIPYNLTDHFLNNANPLAFFTGCDFRRALSIFQLLLDQVKNGD